MLHLVQRGGHWAGPQPAQGLLAVPNVTAHPSTASVPITVLLYNGPLICGFSVPIKGLSLLVCHSVCASVWDAGSSEIAERIWLKFPAGTEVCPEHCIAHFGGDGPRGSPGEPKMYDGGDIVSAWH